MPEHLEQAAKVAAGQRPPGPARSGWHPTGHETFLANRLKLRANRYNFAAKGRGAAREGAALLQGLVHCGRCGRQMGVSYGRQRPRYQCRRAQIDRAESMCQSFVAGGIGGTVAQAFLEAVRPAGLEATLAALRELGRERQDADRQWQLRLERARYEARLAQRQYDTVDPDNRLVARELERRWEAALAETARLQEEYERLRLTELRPLDHVEVAQVRRLASDLPALWHADTTTPVDRKRLLRLVIAAVTVTVQPERGGAEIVVLWSGGARTTYWVESPDPGRHLRTEAGVLETIRALSGRMPDHQIAAALTLQGLRTRHGKPWTQTRVASMRCRYGIPTACPANTGGLTSRADGFVPARVAARRLGITLAAIRVWAMLLAAAAPPSPWFGNGSAWASSPPTGRRGAATSGNGGSHPGSHARPRAMPVALHSKDRCIMIPSRTRGPRTGRSWPR